LTRANDNKNNGNGTPPKPQFRPNGTEKTKQTKQKQTKRTESIGETIEREGECIPTIRQTNRREFSLILIHCIRTAALLLGEQQCALRSADLMGGG
jgi:hypothetical protein